METILANIGAIFGYSILGIGTVSAATYALFKIFSEKWLNEKFEKRLAEYKHEQQKELEQLRFTIAGLMDRTTKLYQREFDVLPEAWGRLVIAHGHVQAAVSALQQYPDLDSMVPEHLSEFIDKSPLADWQKAELRNAKAKTEYYSKAINWHRAREAGALYREFFIYLRKNGIFIREEIKSKFTELSDLLHAALGEY
jgi:hypothetical protein